MEKIYFIDADNVESKWINLLKEKNAKKCKFLIFYSKKSKLEYEKVEELLNLKGLNIEFIFCGAKATAIKMGISTFLGYMITSKENSDLIIYSEDDSFNEIIDFWDKRNVKITRTSPSLSDDLDLA